MSGPRWILLAVPASAIAIVTSLVPFFDDAIYRRETADWSAQATGQDIANLVVYPLLAVLAVVAWRGSTRAMLVALGLLGYSAYMFAVYCLDVHWNRLFLGYVAVFGLSLWALAGGLAAIDMPRVAWLGRSAPTRAAVTLLVGLAVVFAVLWLSIELPAAVRGRPPSELADVGLPTNPVHVLDLAVFLPAMAFAGLMLRARRPVGYVLAPVLLTGAAAIGVGIVALTGVSAHRGLDAAWPAAGAIAVLVAVESAVLARLLLAVGRPV